LLLTFFYRQMPELIANGYLYIAQPPLYKVTRNKKDQYLKNEKSLDEYLLAIAAERAKVRTSTRELTGSELRTLMEQVITYQGRLEKLSSRKDPRIMDALVFATHIDETTLLDIDSLNAQVEALSGYLTARYPDVAQQLKVFRKDDPEHQAKKLVFKTDVNGAPRETVLDHQFLSSPEYRELVSLRKAFDALGPAPYTVVLEDGDVVVHSVQETLAAIRKAASDGLNIQRYKGLGEMTAIQLWETTMDPSTRTLLQVRVDDAVVADEMFSLLMGEAVEPRREFIEKNALEVQNLDI
jgi:DNA gyrase subunit B